jgi:hypothetical protein
MASPLAGRSWLRAVPECREVIDRHGVAPLHCAAGLGVTRTGSAVASTSQHRIVMVRASMSSMSFGVHGCCALRCNAVLFVAESRTGDAPGLGAWRAVSGHRAALAVRYSSGAGRTDSPDLHRRLGRARIHRHSSRPRRADMRTRARAVEVRRARRVVRRLIDRGEPNGPMHRVVSVVDETQPGRSSQHVDLVRRRSARLVLVR